MWLVDVVCLWQRKEESKTGTERANDRISLCFWWQSMSRECSVYKSWRMPCCYHSDCCYSLKQNPSGSALFPTHTDAPFALVLVSSSPCTYLISIDGTKCFAIVLLVRCVCESVIFATVNTQHSTAQHSHSIYYIASCFHTQNTFMYLPIFRPLLPALQWLQAG